MIPKPLSEIAWADIEALRDSGREEDDTIEFKSSFSGGSDYLDFSDSKRVKAIEGIAREAVAFLNGRGGDIIIGVREASNDHPKIEEITPVQNIDQTVARLEQSLSALIEPTQSILRLRAVREKDGDIGGVIIVRCLASLRAPHRFSPTKECYIRRGRSSVPMPMDEVQDVTLNRASLRSERNSTLDGQFEDISGTQFGLQTLSRDRSHFRICYISDTTTQVDLDRDTLAEFRGSDLTVSNGKRSMRNDVAFEGLSYNWKPDLRGRVIEHFGQYGDDEFHYVRKSIKNSILMKCDFALNHRYTENGMNRKVVNLQWLIGFFANGLHSMRSVLSRNVRLSNGVVRVAAYFSDGQHLAFGERMWGTPHVFPVGLTQIPDFTVSGPESFNEIFQQVQKDICEIVGVESPEPFSLPPQ